MLGNTGVQYMTFAVFYFLSHILEDRAMLAEFQGVALFTGIHKTEERESFESRHSLHVKRPILEAAKPKILSKGQLL